MIFFKYLNLRAYRGCVGLQADAIIHRGHEGVLTARLQHPRPHHQIVPTQRRGGQGIPGQCRGRERKGQRWARAWGVRVKEMGRLGRAFESTKSHDKAASTINDPLSTSNEKECPRPLPAEADDLVLCIVP